jgi:hypothetical protein
MSQCFFCCCCYFFLYFLYSFIHMCVHCLGHFSPPPALSPFPPPCLPPPHPVSLPHPFCHSPSCFQAEPVLSLSLILLKRRHKHNKEDKAFLLVELRIAIQTESQYCFHVQMCSPQVDSFLTDLYTDS